MPAVDEHSGTITSAVDRALAEVWTGFTHFAEGDVIFAKITPCMENGKAAVARGLTNGLACGSTEFFVLRPGAGIHADFIWRFIRQQQFRSEAEQHMSGAVGQRRVPRRFLEEYILGLPPTAEQRRIVAKLDALTARLARARAELDRVPVLAERLRQTFTSALATHTGLPIVRFDEVLDYKGGSQPPKSTFYSDPGDGRIRLLQIRDFASDAKAVYINDNGKWPRCLADDVMIGRYGASVGKILTGKAGAYNVALVKMIFDRSIVSPRYLFHWLTGATFQDRLKSISRSAQDGFNKGDLGDLPFPLPPLSKQEQIAAATDAAFARAERMEAEATRARALIDRLEAAILAKAFRGELVPQDPNDEPASVLLDRIRAQRAAAPSRRRRAGSQS